MGCLFIKSKKTKKNNDSKSVRMSKSPLEKQKERLYEIKIVLLGDQAVGKSSLVNRFCSGNFDDKYKSTIGGAYLQKEVTLKNGDILKLHIWDTGGQEKFRSMASLYYKDSVAAILVYDISNPESFESLSFWVKELRENVENDNFVISVAGNKNDLPFEEKKVAYNQAKSFMKDNGITIFYETSAKIGNGVKELFTGLAQEVYEVQKKINEKMEKEKENINNNK